MNPDSPMAELEEPLISAVPLTAGQTTSFARSGGGGRQGRPAKLAGTGGVAPKTEDVQIYDFRNPMPLSPGEIRQLREHEEEFVQSAASRLSAHLGLEFSLKLAGVKTVAYQKLAESWSHPAHLTLFKMEPLRGVSILEVSSRLGLGMVDRLMGGTRSGAGNRSGDERDREGAVGTIRGTAPR